MVRGLSASSGLNRLRSFSPSLMPTEILRQLAGGKSGRSDWCDVKTTFTPATYPFSSTHNKSVLCRRGSLLVLTKGSWLPSGTQCPEIMKQKLQYISTWAVRRVTHKPSIETYVRI
uniref:Uncharacterized protein n=1 Tax=Schistocephalus solidus TaxID=70667 RepID=A0A0X3PKN8_SCHSO